MSTIKQIVFVGVCALIAVLQLVSAQGHSYTQLTNGLGFKYSYGIHHGHHGHAYGSSYPNGYGGFGTPAAGTPGGYGGGYGRGFVGGFY